MSLHPLRSLPDGVFTAPGAATNDRRPAVAWCWRTGAIEIAVLTGRSRPPRGTIVIARAPATLLDQAIIAVARHAYDGKTLLVPGIPEAASDQVAIDALEAFIEQVTKRLAALANMLIDDGETLH